MESQSNTNSKCDGSPIDGSNWDDLSFAEAEGRRQILEYHRFLKDCVPGFQNSYLLKQLLRLVYERLAELLVHMY